MKRWGILLIVFLCLFSFSGTAVFALSTIEQGSFVLPREETHVGDLFINTQKAVIDGTVDGDVYVFAESVQINGEVKGDVIAFAANTLVHGKIDGNLRSFTQTAMISGTVTRNITSFNQNLLISQEGHVTGSILTFAESFDMMGQVDRDANGFVNTMRIGGKLGKGTSLLKVNNLTIDSTAHIGGNLTYSSPNQAIIRPGAQMNGTEQFTQVKEEEKEKKIFAFLPGLFLLMSLLSTLIIWLLIRFLFPKALHQIQQRIDGELTPLFGLGALLLFGVPIVSVILLLSIIGIPIGLTLLFSLIVLVYVAKIFVGTWLGTRITRRYQWPLHPLLAEFLGVLVVYGLLQVPFLGWLLSLLVGMLFLGAAGTVIRQSNCRCE